MNLSNNDFIRTTEKRHYKSVEDLWNKLVNSGDIYLDKYKGWYSISDEAYYDDDEIEKKTMLKYQNYQGPRWNGSKKNHIFLNYQLGQKNYLNIIKIFKFYFTSFEK